MPLRPVVADYRMKYKPRLDEMLSYFAGMPSLEHAIEAAALARRPDGKRYRHQWRIQRSVLEQGARALRAIESELASSATFRELHDLVVRATYELRRFGELTRYDAALRIGACRAILPADVYLHAGTRAGCKALGLDATADVLPVSVFPEPLRELRPHEIEDLVCIYKKQLARGGEEGSAPPRGCLSRPSTCG